MVTSCMVLPNPSRNSSGLAQPGTRTCQSAMRWPLNGAGVSRRLCTVVSGTLGVDVTGDVADPYQHGMALSVKW